MLTGTTCTMTGFLNRADGCFHREENPAGRSRRACAGGYALRLASEGEWVKIISLAGGKGLRDRLAGMGLRVGSEIQVLRNNMDEKLLLGHGGARLFIGGGMARKIHVTAIKGENR